MTTRIDLIREVAAEVAVYYASLHQAGLQHADVQSLCWSFSSELMRAKGILPELGDPDAPGEEWRRPR